MAAIKPHLALDNENSAKQNRYWRCTSEGLEGLGDGEVCPAPAEIANEAHAELMSMAWLREALVKRMTGSKLWIEYVEGVPTIAIDQPTRGPEWNPSAGAYNTTILGWTTKMGAPSFSLPAGAPAMGGACPGATAGQTIASPESRSNQAKVLLPVLNEYRRNNPTTDVVNVTQAVCEFCYAEGGKYSTGTVQNAQLMRFAWAQRAIERPGKQPGESEFYSVMLDAINKASFKSGSEPNQYAGKRFFRIHDSGDFFSLDYLVEWKKISLYYHPLFGGEGLRFNEPRKGESRKHVSVAQVGVGHPNPIYFWAPTRVWAKGMREVQEVSKINGLEIRNLPTWDNFSIRPSAYHINEHGPFVALPGWAAPSTVYDHHEKTDAEGKAFDWDCKAYAVKDGPSCRGAMSDPTGSGKGKEGCRECWIHPTKAVNYTLHL